MPAKKKTKLFKKKIVTPFNKLENQIYEGFELLKKIEKANKNREEMIIITDRRQINYFIKKNGNASKRANI